MRAQAFDLKSCNRAQDLLARVRADRCAHTHELECAMSVLARPDDGALQCDGQRPYEQGNADSLTGREWAANDDQPHASGAEVDDLCGNSARQPAGVIEDFDAAGLGIDRQPVELAALRSARVYVPCPFSRRSDNRTVPAPPGPRTSRARALATLE